jgi:hypothetical protein
MARSGAKASRDASLADDAAQVTGLVEATTLTAGVWGILLREGRGIRCGYRVRRLTRSCKHSSMTRTLMTT